MLLDFEKELINKKIFVTGHTGFTGSWVCSWLNMIGVDICGYSLQPETNPSLFLDLKLEQEMQSNISDICNYENLYKSIKTFQPDLILHLAAQPLVRKSYLEPIKTFHTNIIGTANVLEAARQTQSVKGILCITTDKVYENKEWLWQYRENDRLGGKDPYSASKSAAEIVIRSFALSYPSTEFKGPAIATVRGGNIIGGGDWSQDRLIPDFVKAIKENTKLKLRYPNAIRPWQHVLALVHGYLIILAGLISSQPDHFARPWNLGPAESKYLTVQNIVELMSKYWREVKIDFVDSPITESKSLTLDSTLARNLLNWSSAWDTQLSVKKTALWYREYINKPENASKLTLNQINSWREKL